MPPKRRLNLRRRGFVPAQTGFHQRAEVARARQRAVRPYFGRWRDFYRQRRAYSLVRRFVRRRRINQMIGRARATVNRRIAQARLVRKNYIKPRDFFYRQQFGRFPKRR